MDVPETVHLSAGGGSQGHGILKGWCTVYPWKPHIGCYGNGPADLLAVTSDVAVLPEAAARLSSPELEEGARVGSCHEYLQVMEVGAGQEGCH